MVTVARRWSARWSLARSAAPAIACDGGRRGGRQSGQPAQRRQQEQDRADQRRDRIARQTEHRHRAEPAEQQRLSRPHGDLPEVQLQAARLQALDDQVVVADRGAAGGHQHVHAVHRIGHRGDRLARVGGDRQHDRLAAGGAHQGGERVRVGTDDAAGRDGLARHGDLVAGGEDGDARTAMHGQPGMVGGGGQRRCRARSAAGRRGPPLAGGEILAGAADVAAGGHRLVHPHLGRRRRWRPPAAGWHRRPSAPRCR